MKAALIPSILEITVRGYTRIEEEGLMSFVRIVPNVSFDYEKDGNDNVFVIQAPTLNELFTFLDKSQLIVKICL